MAVRGVWQLKKLVLYFCDHSGSSRGARYARSSAFGEQVAEICSFQQSQIFSRWTLVMVAR